MRESEFVAYVVDLLSALGGVSPRRMFGGHGLYRDGTMFALIADDTLYFKVGADNLPDFEAAGARPFTYERGHRRIALSYYEVPADIVDDAEALCDWARKARDAALKASSRRKPRATDRRAR